ncbi:hypothetical protein R3P38DRAFT_3253402 [Favolaschia claudopus]|uniref:F-box domain-containing protein n=1 Tax=Favolaschia claudopus TaxID=2862362 RepID=A0AAW0DTR9_9AGAR
MDLSPLLTIPPEVLEYIAFQLTCLQPLGPPSALLPLLLTCKAVNKRLDGNSALYARIFRFKFDSSAVRRRAFVPKPAQYHDQLILYCKLLQNLRAPVCNDCDEVLFGAYLMMLENDGRNAAQLTFAGLDSYLDIYVRTRLWDGRQQAQGWPLDDAACACALWLVWMTTTEERLKAESAPRRNQMIQLVLPFVLVPFRYASAFAPPHHFRLPLLPDPVVRHDSSIVTAHGPYPVYLDPERAWSQIHFASRPLMAPPLATVAAKLVYFSRRESVSFSVPPALPVNRAAALEAGRHDVQPTQEDIREVNAHLNSRLPETRAPVWGGEDAEHPLSEVWDSDWWRLRQCSNACSEPDMRLGPRYVPGTFTGLWQGRMLIPSEDHLAALITTGEYPAGFDEAYVGTTTFPLFMRIAEHHWFKPSPPAPSPPSIPAGWDDGLANAFFPRGTKFVPTNSYPDGKGNGKGLGATYDPHRGVEEGYHDPDTCEGCRTRERCLRDGRAEAEAAAREELFERIGMGRAVPHPTASAEMRAGGHWAAYDGDKTDLAMEDETPPPPAHDPTRVPPCTGIRDIIFTGATDLCHGQAWNHFTFYGRVRLWDGLIVILRVSPKPQLGTLFFYGFVVGGHKFVGNWRVASQDVGVPAYESAFSMARRED